MIYLAYARHRASLLEKLEAALGNVPSREGATFAPGILRAALDAYLTPAEVGRLTTAMYTGEELAVSFSMGGEQTE